MELRLLHQLAIDFLWCHQRDVLDVALDLGYDDVPRGAARRDIADRLDLSIGTVSDHLQKIESRVFETIRP